MVLLSAGLQILAFPLADLYFVSWAAVTPLLVALLRAREPDTLQLRALVRLLPATPAQAFLLAYVCGILWYAGTCYWVYNTMRQYGGVGTPGALGLLLLFCLYLGIYHGVFGLLVSLLAGPSRRASAPEANSLNLRALTLAPFIWVAVELARTRITGFPWNLLGIAQVDNVPLCRLATVTGVYGLSFEIMIVNTALAAAFVIRGEKSRRRPLFLAALAAAVLLQSTRWVAPPAVTADHSARLVQQNIPIVEGEEWTKEYFDGTLRDLAWISLHRPGTQGSDNAGTAQGAAPHRPQLIVWPESPAPFYTYDPVFRDTVSSIAREAGAWVLAGSLGMRNAGETPGRASEIYNSASLVSPAGEWVGRYDKIHLVPFGEYLPFKRVFGFASGLTRQVGDFTQGSSRAPLQTDAGRLGVFICYESIFPNEVRQLAAQGAEVFVNISNDGWYGDSGAYAQHLKQARMRAIENNRWLLRDTNTGVTAAIDPYGRVVSSLPRKVRAVLDVNYALTGVTTFYTRHGDWFAYLCAIISMAGVLLRHFSAQRHKTGHDGRT